MSGLKCVIGFVLLISTIGIVSGNAIQINKNLVATGKPIINSNSNLNSNTEVHIILDSNNNSQPNVSTNNTKTSEDEDEIDMSIYISFFILGPIVFICTSLGVYSKCKECQIEKEWQKNEWYNLYKELMPHKFKQSKIINKKKNLLTYFKI